MSFFSFSRKPVKKVGLVLDLGSKTVGGAIFEKDQSGAAKVLYVAREPIAFQKILSGESLYSALKHSFELVIIHLEKYGLKHLNADSKFNYQVDSIAGVFSSPWHISETKILKYSEDESFVVTEVLINDLLAKEEKEFMARLSSNDKEISGYELLEHRVIEMRLNGYATSSPYGKSAKELELHFFASVSPAGVFEKIRELALSHFPVSHFDSHTFPLVAFASLRNIFPNEEHFLIVQVGGELTELTIVKSGVIAETVSFPLGHNGLLRALNKICGEHLGCNLESLLSIHREAKINLADKKKVEQAIADTRTAWLKFLTEAISNFSVETFLPKTVFLFEDAPYSSLFEDFLKSVELGQFTITGESFSVKTATEFEALFAAANNTAITNDPVLNMEADFVLRFPKRI